MSKQLSFSVANILSGHVSPRFPWREGPKEDDHHIRSWSLSSCDSVDVETCDEAKRPSRTDKRVSPPSSPLSTASVSSPITDIVSGISPFCAQVVFVSLRLLG